MEVMEVMEVVVVEVEVVMGTVVVGAFLVVVVVRARMIFSRRGSLDLAGGRCFDRAVARH